MHRWTLLAPLLGALSPSAAGAAEMQWEGTLAFEWLLLPPVELHGSGVSTIETFPGGARLQALRLSGGITDWTLVPVTDPLVTGSIGITAIRATATLGSGTFARFSSLPLTQGTLPVAGGVKLCTSGFGCLALGLTKSDGAVGLGVGGILTINGFGTGFQVSVEAAPWTVGTTTVTLPTASGGVLALATAGWLHGPFSVTGSTALTGGQVSLVTPLQVSSDVGQPLAAFARLTVRFAPEPGLLLLLTVASVGLAALGRSRARGERR